MSTKINLERMIEMGDINSLRSNVEQEKNGLGDNRTRQKAYEDALDSQRVISNAVSQILEHFAKKEERLYTFGLHGWREDYIEDDLAKKIQKVLDCYSPEEIKIIKLKRISLSWIRVEVELIK